MRCTELDEHHLELIEDGFEWCPECGILLECYPETVPQPRPTHSFAPVVTGDCPPLTSDELWPVA